MSNLRLAEEGMLESGPSTSGVAELPDTYEINAEEEKSRLADSDEDSKSGQSWPTVKRRHEEQQGSERRKRPRQDDSAKALESKIKKRKNLSPNWRRTPRREHVPSRYATTFARTSRRTKILKWM